jgi:sterol 3beta-glucosyltransferase
MRVLLVTVGSQGDVQPFVALSARLRGAGHEAVLAAPAMFRGLAAAGGVAFAPLDLDMTEVGRAIAGRHGLRPLFAFSRAMGRRAGGALPGAVAGATAHGPVDVVLHHPVLPIGQHLAEMLGVPAVVAALAPALVPTHEFLSAAWLSGGRLPGARLPPVLNRPSYRAARYLTGAWCRREIDGWRRDALSLSRRPGRHDPLDGPPGGKRVNVLHAFSPHVVPRPADWPATAHITGYWLAGQDPSWSPPGRLARFLDAADPPVYLGFGSMPIDSPATLAEAITAAARETGARFIVGSSDPVLTRRLAGAGGRVLMVRQVPHDWLFPQTAAVVHHGGAGTTAAAIIAGRPQLIWPFGIDQHFWAARMADLGVAVPAGPVWTLTGARLARAVGQATSDRRVTDQARDLASLVRAEDGVGQAVACLERLASGASMAVSA